MDAEDPVNPGMAAAERSRENLHRNPRHNDVVACLRDGTGLPHGWVTHGLWRLRASGHACGLELPVGPAPCTASEDYRYRETEW